MLLVTIAVFGLFHPHELDVLTGSQRARVSLQTPTPFKWPENNFVLTVPGRISRRFSGRLTIYREGRELVPVVAMDLETAVSSIVAAESPPGAMRASLEAQAVVARSFLRASQRRHAHADFCDTTHCQFLREPPESDSEFARAAAATANVVLQYEGRTVEAMYSGDCGGSTRTLADARMLSHGYPFFAVVCPLRTGIASGHRIGLCQRGAAAMAARGQSWREILRHYFPAAVAVPAHR